MNFLLTILLVLISSNLYSSSVYSIRVNDSKFNVKALNHYGNDLISANQVSSYILPKSKYISKENKIEANDYTISFTPGTVYIVKENWLGRRVAQLDLPVLSMKRKVYFPLRSLIFSLDSLNIYNVLAGEDEKHFLLADNSFSGLTSLPKIQSLTELEKEARQSLNLKSTGVNNAIIFSSGDGKSVKVNESEPFKKSFLELNKKLSKSFKSLKPEKFVPSEPAINEVNRIDADLPQYVIPEDLIRKELEEVKNKKPN